MMLPLVLASVLVAPRPTLLAHYMPWFASRPISGAWGWHWSMGKTDPERGDLASHFHPLLGAYDSGDPDLLECHVQLLKLAGFDGALIDWYGDVDCLDYASIDRNTGRLIEILKRAQMKFGLVYEDQTVRQLVDRGKIPSDQAVPAGRGLFDRTAARWFTDPLYLTYKGRPLLLVFGPQFYEATDWPTILSAPKTKPALFTLHNPIPTGEGTFDWPLPSGGGAAAKERRQAYIDGNSQRAQMIPVAYPRFRDYYDQAGVHASYGEVEDREGLTYRETLTTALALGSPLVQVATFNDWGEGTVIEPSKEFGYRDLEFTQSVRKAPFRPTDLRLPIELYQLRKQNRSAADTKTFAKISAELLAGNVVRARQLFAAFRAKQSRTKTLGG